jgi:hypothetical protein
VRPERSSVSWANGPARRRRSGCCRTCRSSDAPSAPAASAQGGAFGTDRYPPFSLRPDPAYPADFDVDYPQRLSRGLVLVKWWLLALPQLLIVAVLAGGSGLHFGNVIGLLALVAAVMLAATGTYPREVFDLLMGFNRWCYRVLAYVALMRDEYPPFRLDTGGEDPGHVPAGPPPAPEPAGVSSAG